MRRFFMPRFRLENFLSAQLAAARPATGIDVAFVFCGPRIAGKSEESGRTI
jgi:hypothetical protein